MKKLIIVLVVVAAGTGAAVAAWQYGLFEPQGSAPDGSSLNAHVPADTLFYFGGLEPIPSREIMAAFDVPMTGLSEDDMEELRREMEQEDMQPGVAVLTGLFFELNDLGFPDALNALGVADELDYAAYTVGLSPVYRMRVDDPARFTATLDRVEAKMDAAPLSTSREGGASLRRYRLMDESDSGRALELGIAIGDDQIVLFIDDETLGGDDVRSLAIGGTLPEDGLAGSGRLEAMAEEHGFLSYNLGYVDFREMVSAVIDADGNRAGRALDRLVAEEPELGETLADLRAGACRDDLTGIAAMWPGISSGYTRMDLDGQPTMAADVILEIRDEAILEGLDSLRGHIPTHLLSDDPQLLVGAALGLDADALPGFLRSSWQRYTQADFTCPALVESQQELRQNNPAMIGPAMAFAEGFKGISVTLLDVVLPESDGKEAMAPKSAEAVVTVSAEDPQGLMSMAAAMFPALAQIEVPDDGSAVPLDLPGFWQALKPKMARHEHHVTVFAGDEGEQLAGEVGAEPLQTNGLFSLVMDYKLYDKVPDFGEGEGGEALRELFDQLGDQDLVLRYDFDVTEGGLRMRVWMKRNDA